MKKIEAKIIALNIIVEGMKAENIIRETNGDALAYTADDFNRIAERILTLAEELKE